MNVTHPCKQVVVAEPRRALPGRRCAGRGEHDRVRRRRLVGPQHRLRRLSARLSRVGLPGARTDRVVLLGAGGAGAGGRARGPVAGRRTGHGPGRRPRTRGCAGRVARPQLRRPRRGRGRRGDLGRPACRRRRSDPRDAHRHGRPARHRRACASCSTRACGWPRSCTCRSRRNCCKDARERGCRTLDGGGMVALQAAGSLELFTGARPDRDRMLRHVDALIEGRGSQAREAPRSPRSR